MKNKSSTNQHIQPWKRIHSTKIFEHPQLTLIEDEVELANGHRTAYLRYNTGQQSVTIICIREGCILLQQEYSYPPNAVLYQFPGGKVEKGELILETAKRELEEESHFTCKVEAIHELGWYYSNNRRSDAKMHVVLINNPSALEVAIDGDPEEHSISTWIPISEFESMLGEGEITNFSVLAAWTLFKAKQAKGVLLA